MKTRISKKALSGFLLKIYSKGRRKGFKGFLDFPGKEVVMLQTFK
jgi:hypothetical protein